MQEVVSRRLRELERLLGASGVCWLVGSGVWFGFGCGVVADQDYVTTADPEKLAQRLSHKLQGRAFLLDPQRQYWRIVAPRLPVLDLAPMASQDIGLDLSRRDFTINAMAAMLPDRKPVLDPFDGLADLRHGLIRQVSTQALHADPLRVLRGLRLASEHGFVIEEQTLQTMCRASPGLRVVKPERIRAELLRALQAPGWQQMTMDALRLGVWSALPVRPSLEPSGARLAAYLERVAELGPLICEATSHLGGIAGLSEERSRAVAVLAAVSRASGRNHSVTDISRRLRLSTREAHALAAIVASSLAALDLNPADAVAVYGLVERHGAAAAWGAGLTGGRGLLEAMLRLRLPEADGLPDGRQIAAALGRPPGPWLGSLIARLRRAVATGEVRPSEALRVAAEWMGTGSSVGGAADEERPSC